MDIEKKGEGIHHLAIKVDSVEETISRMESSGVEMIDKKPRDGAHKSRIAFVHPKSTGGFLVEFVEDKHH
ncbi:MAG: VOC family protein [Oligoflexales bacterium]|nr:VOC family protein [Oligoflexales bacterium]